MRKKVLITGSRTINDKLKVTNMLNRLLVNVKDDIEMLFGDADGVDKIAWDWCKLNDIPYQRYKPDWDTYGRAAGPMRNTDMINQLTKDNCLVIAFWDKKSRGTKDVINKARAKDLFTIVITR